MSEGKFMSEEFISKNWVEKYTSILSDLTNGMDFNFTIQCPDEYTIIVTHDNADTVFRNLHQNPSVEELFTSYIIYVNKYKGVSFMKECANLGVKAYTGLDFESIDIVQNNEYIFCLDHDKILDYRQFDSDRYIFGDELNLLYIHRDMSKTYAIKKFKNTIILVHRIIVDQYDSLSNTLYKTIDDTLYENQYDIVIPNNTMYTYTNKGVHLRLLDNTNFDELYRLFGVDFYKEFSNILTKYNKYSNMISEYNSNVYGRISNPLIDVASCILSGCPDKVGPTIGDYIASSGIENVAIDEYLTKYPNIHTTNGCDIGYHEVPDKDTIVKRMYTCDKYIFDSEEEFHEFLSKHTDFVIYLNDIRKKQYDFNVKYKYRAKMKVIVDPMNENLMWNQNKYIISELG